MLPKNETKEDQELTLTASEESKEANRDVKADGFPRKSTRTGMLIFSKIKCSCWTKFLAFQLANPSRLLY